MTRTVLVALVAVLASVAAVPATAAHDRPAAREAKLERALDRLVAAGAPGAIALIRDGDRTIRLTSGHANLTQRRPMRAGDRFRVGSITKTFVATVVLQLVGEGELRLTDSVERWLPGLVANGGAITVRQLLNHTSGLFSYDEDREFLAAADRDPLRKWTPRELVAIATAHEPHFAPGAGWSYSGTGYILLGLIVERVSGNSLGSELRRRIFAPLRLRATSLPTAPGIAGQHADGYNVRPLEEVSVESPSLAWAAGALVSNGDDLARFFRALLQGRLLRPKLLRTMQTTLESGAGAGQGLGLGAVRLPCGTVWGFSGGVAGYSTHAFSSKDGNRQVIVLVNVTGRTPPDYESPRPVARAELRALMTAICGVAVPAAAPERTPKREADLQHALDGLVTAGAPGAVALVREGSRTLRLTSGYAQLGAKRRMRAGDRFRVGSTTKTFVATVVLQLVGEGKLSLENTVERWLPGLVRNGQGITLRQLLNHTSGLFDYTEDARIRRSILHGDRTRVWAPRRLVEIATSHEPHFAPGARWSYSNTGYVLLGLIAEAASGHSLGRELRERIFEPLDLRATTFPTRARIAGRHAHGYGLLGRRRLHDVSLLDPSWAWAAGALVSTVSDLARFHRALLGGRLLRPDLLRAMQTTVPVTAQQRYGLGLFTTRWPCGLSWGHGGDIPGYWTLIENTKDGRRQVVLALNANDESLPKRAQEARELFLFTAFCG